MDVPTSRRIVLLGKTGAGKSSLANNIIGENLFTTDDTPNTETSECQAISRSVNGRSLTLIDTPGFFDTNKSEEELKPEILRSIIECSPGPHAFLIVLKVEKFTEHEKAVITQMCKYFSEDVLKYAVVVFTHGDQLPEGQKIEESVSPSEGLSDLVKKCGGRCHVVDNKYWKNNQQGEYRSNQFQVEELLKTIDNMVLENNGGYYTNDMLQAVENEIQEEEEEIRQNSGNMSVEEIRIQAESKVFDRFLTKLTGITTGILLGAFLGVVSHVEFIKAVAAVAAAGGAEAAVIAAGVTAGLAAVAGGVRGGMIGLEAAERAETPQEAAQMAFNSVIEKRKAKLKQL